MPNFPVTEVPYRISQMLTQPALLQNIGNETIYLDSVSTVGPFSYGLGLVPRSTVNWPADRELWAATDSGVSSSISILYNADGTSLSEISATVSGSIDLGSPVNVQGGGEELLVHSDTVPAGSSVSFDVPAPASGLTYYGLRCFFQHNGGGDPETPLKFSIANNGPGFSPPTETQVMSNTAPALHRGTFGSRNRATFITPMTGPYPIPVIVSNPSVNAASFTLQVNGISQSQPYAIDAGTWTEGLNSDAAVILNASPLNSVVIIAPSFHDRRFYIDMNSSTAGMINVETFNTQNVPAWIDSQFRPFKLLFGGTASANALQSPAAAEFIIPGTGRPHRLIVTTAIVGVCSIAYAGRV